MKVISYFHDPKSPLFQADVIGLWAMSFTRMGFEVKLCTESDAKRHPLYGEFKKMVLEVPTPNPLYYSEGNFLRWLAAEMEAPCLMTDWDVLNLKLLPRSYCSCDEPLLLDRKCVPCAVAGTPLAFAEFLAKLKRFRECLHPHGGMKIGGDMYVMQHFYKTNTGQCDEASCRDSASLELVHFPNALASAGAAFKGCIGNNRAKYMREFYAKHFKP